MPEPIVTNEDELLAAFTLWETDANEGRVMSEEELAKLSVAERALEARRGLLHYLGLVRAAA